MASVQGSSLREQNRHNFQNVAHERRQIDNELSGEDTSAERLKEILKIVTYPNNRDMLIKIFC